MLRKCSLRYRVRTAREIAATFDPQGENAELSHALFSSLIR